MHGKTEKPINQWPLATPSEEKKKKCKKRRNRERERERRKTSPCNLLPQHSVSDVVWHLVHKANQIHTLPSYISGNGVSGGRVMGNESKRQKLGAGDRGGGVDGGAGGWMCVWGGVKKKGKSKSFVFTHTESLPETLDHISDSLLSSLLTQSHVKDWWARWWTKINQSHSHSHRQTAREAGEQPGRSSSVSKTRPRFSLAKSRSLLFPFFFLFFCFFLSGHSAAACCPLLSVSWLCWTVVLIGAFKGLQRKNSVVKLTIREQFKCWTHFLLSDHLTC